MVFKLAMEAQKHWRRLYGPELVVKVVSGVKFVETVIHVRNDSSQAGLMSICPAVSRAVCQRLSSNVLSFKFVHGANRP